MKNSKSGSRRDIHRLSDEASNCKQENSSKYDYFFSIKISNLPRNTTLRDIDRLVESIGPKKIFVGEDKTSGHSLGFAIVKFKSAPTDHEYILLGERNSFSFEPAILQLCERKMITERWDYLLDEQLRLQHHVSSMVINNLSSNTPPAHNLTELMKRLNQFGRCRVQLTETTPRDVREGSLVVRVVLESEDESHVVTDELSVVYGYGSRLRFFKSGHVEIRHANDEDEENESRNYEESQIFLDSPAFSQISPRKLGKPFGQIRKYAAESPSQSRGCTFIRLKKNNISERSLIAHPNEFNVFDWSKSTRKKRTVTNWIENDR